MRIAARRMTGVGHIDLLHEADEGERVILSSGR
jgi:hypothetical protein